jgi:predicted GIY-YIG superfamily endonuclease
MVSHVYILKVQMKNHERMYVGKANDIFRRIDQHLDGKSHIGLCAKKLDIVYLEEIDGYNKEALARERELKKLGTTKRQVLIDTFVKTEKFIKVKNYIENRRRNP